jgi:hypothetical protein
VEMARTVCFGISRYSWELSQNVLKSIQLNCIYMTRRICLVFFPGILWGWSRVLFFFFWRGSMRIRVDMRNACERALPVFNTCISCVFCFFVVSRFDLNLKTLF